MSRHPTRMRWVGLLTATFVVISWWPQATPAQAERRFAVPVAVGDGFLKPDGQPEIYFASVRIDPTVRLLSRPKLNLAATGATAYTYPKVYWLGGGRVTVDVYTFSMAMVPLATIRLGAEGLWGTGDRGMLGGALELDVGADGLLLLTLRGARDYRQDANVWGFYVGINLITWFGRPDSGVKFPDDI